MSTTLLPLFLVTPCQMGLAGVGFMQVCVDTATPQVSSVISREDLACLLLVLSL